jgi:hypothetical protein
VARQSAEQQYGRLRIDGAVLRQRLAAVAAAIACTEDQVAETMERMALVLPESAARLRAQAAQAREHATLERSRAAVFETPCRSWRAVSATPPGRPIEHGP